MFTGRRACPDNANAPCSNTSTSSTCQAKGLTPPRETKRRKKGQRCITEGFGNMSPQNYCFIMVVKIVSRCQPSGY